VVATAVATGLEVVLGAWQEDTVADMAAQVVAAAAVTGDTAVVCRTAAVAATAWVAWMDMAWARMAWVGLAWGAMAWACTAAMGWMVWAAWEHTAWTVGAWVVVAWAAMAAELAWVVATEEHEPMGTPEEMAGRHVTSRTRLLPRTRKEGVLHCPSDEQKHHFAPHPFSIGGGSTRMAVYAFACLELSWFVRRLHVTWILSSLVLPAMSSDARGHSGAVWQYSFLLLEEQHVLNAVSTVASWKELTLTMHCRVTHQLAAVLMTSQICTELFCQLRDLPAIQSFCHMLASIFLLHFLALPSGKE
jgi:hypothetical protein